MNTKKAKTKWEEEIGKHKEKPVILRKVSLKIWMTDIIDYDYIRYWCNGKSIEKHTKIPEEEEYENSFRDDCEEEYSDSQPNYESGFAYGAEVLANGGILSFQEKEGNNKYILTLDKAIEGFKEFIRNAKFTKLEKNQTIIWNKEKERYEMNMCNAYSDESDTILQYALFGKKKYMKRGEFSGGQKQGETK